VEEPVQIHIDEQFKPEVDAAEVSRLVGAVLLAVGAAAPASLSIVITGDKRLHELNRAYLGVDRPTDVLAFPSGEADPDTGAPYLGDVLISLPQAQRQAAEAGLDLKGEVRLLIVHGVLHLLGYDHGDPEDRERMWATQGAILERFMAGSDQA
jgi:probable rRNA maturation factor